MSCATVPTETQFLVFTTTSDSLSTSFSTFVTTLPPTTVASTIVCSDSTSNSACSATTLIVTGDASTSTKSVPVTLTVPVTFTSSTPTRTLFSTSCSSTSTSSTNISSNILTSQSSQPTPTLTPTSSQSSTSSTSLSTPPPLVSSSVTLSDGNPITTQVVVTTTSSPPSVVVTPSSTPSLNQSGTGGGNSSSNTAPIIGGAVGGVIAVLATIGIIWYIRRRSKRWNDIIDKEEVEDKRGPRMSLGGEDVQPRPYHYGLVGHSSSPSPPSSPPLGAVDRGHSPSNSLSFLNAPPQHSRSSSGVALSSPPSMTRSLSDLNSANPVPQSGLARPSLSTASSATASTRPLLERPVNHARSPSIPTASLLGAGRSQQPDPLTPRPHSAGGSLQSALPPVPVTSTEPTSHSQTSSTSEKRRLLASLPQNAVAPAPPPLAVESSSPVQFPSTDSRAPPIRQRNPNRPSSAKSSNVVTVHVDGGPAAEADQQSRPEGNEPPAYSPT